MTNSFIKKILIIIGIVSGNAYSATQINLKDYLLNELKYFDNAYCQMTVTVTDNFGNLIKKERLNKTIFFVDDYEEDRKISWIAETSIDKNNPNFSSAKYNCPSTGTVWQSQLLGTLWNDVETWGEPIMSCIKTGLKHKGFVYYKEKQNDSSTKYFSPYHPVFGVVNEGCGEIIRTKLNKSYRCNTNLGESICEDRLAVIRDGKFYPLTINEAIVAKLNKEEIISNGFESLQGKSERLAKDEVKNRKAEEEEKRRVWLAGPEGKKYLADEEVKRKKVDDERLKSESAEKSRIAKEFPFYAVISCGIGSRHITITACFSGDYGSLEIRNGNDYGLYKIVQIANRMIPNSKEQREGLVVNLRNNFEINARNGEDNNIILGVKIIQRNSGNIIFQKQVDNFGSIRIKN